MSKVVLGKGLEALIPSDRGVGDTDQSSQQVVPLDRLAPNPLQPRRDFDETALEQLAESFKRHGVVQPLVVKSDGAGYIIIAGERRYRAAKLAGLTEVPVIMMQAADDTSMLELALVENLQREDLNPIETAEAYHALIEKCGLTQGQLAARVGKSRVAVTNLLRLMSLPEKIKNMLRQGRLTEGHARAVLSFDNEAEMMRQAQRIIDESLSVRDVERSAGRVTKRRLTPKRRMPAIMDAETFLKQTLGTSVKIHHGLRRKKIEIDYYSDDDLDRLLDLFRKIVG
ncbi:MAG: ParB/RepB/Spo0J family partition protein [candidate division Zixibacteria bacterium]|nr:ParB/RepB/Spo0J family partition protein [candidate division Zixibacteria bacterium]MDH3936388.1 ParB/RepB/Spo0J family partition protein [candidate division Zixibacteria bacterium]MDH4033504.1 ParB/RepB/Spo0J family partition protein [candidate division Zixibacteria bacterium]